MLMFFSRLLELAAEVLDEMCKKLILDTRSFKDKNECLEIHNLNDALSCGNCSISGIINTGLLNHHLGFALFPIQRPAINYCLLRHINSVRFLEFCWSSRDD